MRRSVDCAETLTVIDRHEGRRGAAVGLVRVEKFWWGMTPLLWSHNLTFVHAYYYTQSTLAM